MYFIKWWGAIKIDLFNWKHLLMQGTLIKEPQRWSDRLQAYDFEIVYDECKDNIVASALY